MSATYETLQYVDAGGATQEVALAMANVAGSPAMRLVITPASHAPGTCEITWLQPPETGVAIPFKSRCVVWANRASASGAPNSFSGGTPIFVGRRWDNPSSASAEEVSTGILLYDVIKDLQCITYQQAWNQITGGSLASPMYTPFYWPDVSLFQALPSLTYSPAPVNNSINTWQQIVDALTFAQTFVTGADALLFQFGGTAEFTPVYRNWYPLRSAKCWEVILKCLATHPGVYTEVDYSTVDGSGNPLPTLHFRNRAAMTPLTLPYKSTDANGVIHIASNVKPLPELVPDNVRLFYRINGAYNGQPVSSPGLDAYPANAMALLNQDYSIDIAGADQVQTTKNFVSQSFDPTQLSLWRQKVASLHQISQGGQVPNDGAAGALAFVDASPYDPVAHPKGIQVLGDDGTDYSSSYGTTVPYLTDDEIFAWFQLAAGTITVKKVTVKAYFQYSKQTTVAGATITDQIQEHQHTVRAVLCSIPSGRYNLTEVVSQAEAIPTGLAQALWTEQQDLQWQLRHEVFQIATSNTTLPMLVKPGKHKINLAGGAAAWTSMNAVPERVSIELLRVLVAGGWTLAVRTQISCGPVNHLNPEQLIQLANVFRNRDRARVDMGARLTGASSNSQADLSLAATAKENSVPAPALPVETNHVDIVAGAVAGQVITSASKVAGLVTGKTPVGTAGGMMTMQPREIAVCDNTGNNFNVVHQSTEGHQ